uniref:Uncharacterized protein n=1 Tax=viral metagenome TaxID=1070528 RepID=A0A6M3II82_9ZZZZ
MPERILDLPMARVSYSLLAFLRILESAPASPAMCTRMTPYDLSRHFVLVWTETLRPQIPLPPDSGASY